VLRCFSSPGSLHQSYVFTSVISFPLNPEPDRSGSRFNGEDGFPHSEICGSKVAHTSPQLIAACHVLHRLCMPRHPPIALTSRLRIHTTIDRPACITQAPIIRWSGLNVQITRTLVIRHGLGVRSDLSAR